MYKYELFILSDILNCNIYVENQYDEKILEYISDNKDIHDKICIKYDIYNNIISKFYSIYIIS
jgi:hypothetical protein